MNRRAFLKALIAGTVAATTVPLSVGPNRKILGGFSFLEFRRSDYSILVELPEDWQLVDVQAACDKYLYMGIIRRVEFSYAGRRRFIAMNRFIGNTITIRQTPAGELDVWQVLGTGPAIVPQREMPSRHMRLIFT